MKPLTKAVREAFRAQPRPWWVLADLKGGKWFATRKDSLKVWAYAGCPADSNESIEKTVERADSAYPIPHPGYRAGQVWVRETGCSTVILSVTSGRICFFDPENGLTQIPGEEFGRRYPYLMADPSCPNQAPWSRPE